MGCHRYCGLIGVQLNSWGSRHRVAVVFQCREAVGDIGTKILNVRRTIACLRSCYNNISYLKTIWDPLLRFCNQFFDHVIKMLSHLSDVNSLASFVNWILLL